MKFQVWILILQSIFLNMSAYDPLSDLLMPPCFPVKKHPSCNKSLVDSFEPRYLLVELNKPRTMVYLFTPKHPQIAEPLHECGGALPPDSDYDPKADTEIFVHGFIDGLCHTAWMREMKEQLFIRGSYNVVLVDWTWGNSLDFYLAGINSKAVGEQIGFIIKNIMRQTGVGPQKFHIIGHSFGVISAGVAGRMVTNLGRITGLDPPISPFKYAPPEERLTYRDAQIVDVIHSNGVNCFAKGFGDIRQLGHADFYPNGGTIQSSCYTDLIKSFLKGDFLYGLVALLPRFCFHTQSLQYYKASINPNGCEFIGIESASYKEFKMGNSGRSWAVMGMGFDKYPRPNGRKKFYLDTSLKCPYVDNRNLKGINDTFKQNC